MSPPLPPSYDSVEQWTDDYTRAHVAAATRDTDNHDPWKHCEEKSRCRHDLVRGALTSEIMGPDDGPYKGLSGNVPPIIIGARPVGGGSE